MVFGSRPNTASRGMPGSRSALPILWISSIVGADVGLTRQCQLCRDSTDPGLSATESANTSSATRPAGHLKFGACVHLASAPTVLSCQTPQMNDKPLWVHLLAYNVIRLLMAQAACDANVDPRSLSFKHTVQLWTEWTTRGLCTANDRQRLFASIAQCKVGHRPGRIEPRMRKRRPKSYPWLKMSRAQARRQVMNYGHAPRPK